MGGGLRFEVPLCGGLVCSERTARTSGRLYLVSLRKRGDALWVLV